MMPAFIILFYVTIRIGLNSYWDLVNPLYSYLFEVCFVISTYLVFKKKREIKLFKLDLDQKNFLRLLPWPFVGYIIYRLAVKSTILVPFELTSLSTIFFLLVVAPLLEEFIFRFALWEAVSDLIKNEELRVWISAILFSLGHLVSMYLVSPDFRPFILYQSMYVIILGIGTSQMRLKTGGILGSILIHFLFNFGFYVGSLV